MELTFIVIAGLTLSYLLYTSIELTFGFHKIKNLSTQILVPSSRLPKISIILSALNEEDVLEDAISLLMNLDYPQLEVIAVNDRSTDNTQRILEQLHQRYPQLQTHHIHTLPDNWFGKNYALHYAAQRATGDWFLFTDADVQMRGDTITKAISYALEMKIDHLTIYEHHHRHGFWLKLMLLGLYVVYSMFMKPWRIRYSWSKKSVGHGAFNLVSKPAYQACGGHQAIAMECLDDIKLGELLKKNGFKQDTVDGRDFISRSWYTSVSDMVHGLKKNSFAYYNYHLLPALCDLPLAFLFYIWPIVATIFFSGTIRWLNILNVCLMFYISLCVAKHFRLEKRYAIFYPLGIMMMVYTMWNSIFSIYINNGVIWRGTHYPLNKIRKDRVVS